MYQIFRIEFLKMNLWTLKRNRFFNFYFCIMSSINHDVMKPSWEKLKRWKENVVFLFSRHKIWLGNFIGSMIVIEQKFSSSHICITCRPLILILVISHFLWKNAFGFWQLWLAPWVGFGCLSIAHIYGTMVYCSEYCVSMYICWW